MAFRFAHSVLLVRFPRTRRFRFARRQFRSDYDRASTSPGRARIRQGYLHRKRLDVCRTQGSAPMFHTAQTMLQATAGAERLVLQEVRRRTSAERLVLHKVRCRTTRSARPLLLCVRVFLCVCVCFARVCVCAFPCCADRCHLVVVVLITSAVSAFRPPFIVAFIRSA